MLKLCFICNLKSKINNNLKIISVFNRIKYSLLFIIALSKIIKMIIIIMVVVGGGGVVYLTKCKSVGRPNTKVGRETMI